MKGVLFKICSHQNRK